MKQLRGALKIIFILTLFPVASQGSNEAKEGQALRQAFAVVKSIKSDFVQHKRMKILSHPLISKGCFYFQTPDNLRWEYESPIKTVLMLSGGSVKRYTWQKGEYRQTSEAGMEAMHFVLQDISGWLAGDFESSKIFVAAFIAGSPGKVILTPREESLARFIQRVVLTLSARPGVIQSVEIIEDSDSATYIEFRNSEINIDFHESLFTKISGTKETNRINGINPSKVQAP